MILAIAGRELRSQFVSVSAWAVLFLFEFIVAWYFFWFLDVFTEQQGRIPGSAGAQGVTDLVAAPLLHLAAWLMLLVVPILTMRLLAEERRAHTLPLLFSAPVSITEIVLGKYLAMLGILGIMVVLVALLPLSLQLGTDLDFGKLLAGLLGLALVAASFAAVGLYVSTLTSQPTVAAFATLGLLLLLGALIYMLPGSDAAAGLTGKLSLMRHFDALLRGVFDSSNLAFPILFIVLLLGLSIRQLDRERQPG
jgi:ABC-2 type transport system permease protein